ncbi:hypothetical protein [Solimonas terrae]|uniref:Uncharacterized protein n=1 Tax=Solimonas terrae TaxID=1396819 RepID=A0A6M2BWX9_9GAMM|nr:hypothetical protein [Solimonas terrae]NGY06459.1 hypothetical protein [Solimonas terrae]
MNLSVLLLIVFVVAVIVGPFATLHAVSSYRRRRANRAAPRPRAVRDDDDDSSGF